MNDVHELAPLPRCVERRGVRLVCRGVVVACEPDKDVFASADCEPRVVVLAWFGDERCGESRACFGKSGCDLKREQADDVVADGFRERPDGRCDEALTVVCGLAWGAGRALES